MRGALAACVGACHLLACVTSPRHGRKLHATRLPGPTVSPHKRWQPPPWESHGGAPKTSTESGVC